MSLYSAHSPITRGEILEAACAAFDAWNGFFNNIAKRERDRKESRFPKLYLSRRKVFNENSYEDCYKLYHDAYAQMVGRIDRYFAINWKTDEERFKNFDLFYFFKRLIEAQVQSPQYPDCITVWGGPFLLSKEQLLVEDLLCGGCDLEAVMTKIKCDLYTSDHETSPHHVNHSYWGACRLFQKGIIQANNDDPREALDSILRSFIIFLPTGFLWWRNAICEFVLNNPMLRSIVKEQADNDFTLRLLIEEARRQDTVQRHISEFNSATKNAFADYLSFEWLNAPFEETAESQISFGIQRERKPWWK